jgi:hypothetical protein
MVLDCVDGEIRVRDLILRGKSNLERYVVRTEDFLFGTEIVLRRVSVLITCELNLDSQYAPASRSFSNFPRR